MNQFETLLAEKGTNAHRLAKEIGVPYTTLYDWKTGLHKPSVSVVNKVAKYFGVSMESLVDEQEEH